MKPFTCRFYFGEAHTNITKNLKEKKCTTITEVLCHEEKQQQVQYFCESQLAAIRRFDAVREAVRLPSLDLAAFYGWSGDG